MTAIIDLLNEKNEHLEKFYELNEIELANFAAGDFDNVDAFYNAREGLLEIINKLDEMIAREQTAMPEGQKVAPELQAAVLNALDYKNAIVVKILEQDLKILSSIEVRKSELLKEITQIKSARKAIGSYRSGDRDARLDEEA